jgi:hypothetical protein
VLILFVVGIVATIGFLNNATVTALFWKCSQSVLGNFGGWNVSQVRSRRYMDWRDEYLHETCVKTGHAIAQSPSENFNV